MLNTMRLLLALMLAALMTACGGGGGSAGASTGGTGGTTTPPPSPTLTLALLTTTGGVATTVVSAGTPTFLRATVLDTAGAKVAGAIVTFSGGNGLVSFVPTTGTALTDANGIATVEVR